MTLGEDDGVDVGADVGLMVGIVDGVDDGELIISFYIKTWHITST